MAAGLLGPSVHRRPGVLRALEYVHQHDPHPVVTKVAGWYTLERVDLQTVGSEVAGISVKSAV
jgi:hypothetical protein